jgi:hypothetical protein
VIVRVLAFVFVCALSANLLAQTASLDRSASSQPATGQVHYEDGGVSEILQSIFIPPKPRAPFSLTLQTEWVKTLSDGGTITLVNQRHISRDSKGRIFQERCPLIPKDDKFGSRPNVLQIADPRTHILYNCFQDSHKQCVQLDYAGSPSVDYKMTGPPSGELPNGTGTTTHEELGKQFMEGVETVGTRESVTYNPGVFGNDLRMTVEREYWYSPQLGINLLSIRSDPRIGKQTFRATELILGEPDPQLFELPKGFKVVAPTHPPEPDTVEE